MTITARRARDTGDLYQDYLIPLDQEFTIGYAYNSDTSEVGYLSKHEIASSVAITLKSDGTPVWGEFVVAEIVDNVNYFQAGLSEITRVINEFSGASATLT